MARKLGLGAALALSAAVHGGLFGAAAATTEIQRWQERRALERARSAQVEGQERKAAIIRMKKELLVRQAQAAIRDGTFRLDEFLFRAREIEAEEKGERVDLEKAGARYNRYLQGLAEGLRGSVSREELFRKVHEVLENIRYFGAPGGSMVDLLTNGGGGCEPISHLVVSLLGRFPGMEGRLFFRIYSDHIAPILEDGGKYYDIWAGKEDDERGVLIKAEDLVVLYAKKHGIRMPELALGENEASANGVAEAEGAGKAGGHKRYMGGGESRFAYPGTDDAISDGPIPLFSMHAFGVMINQSGDTGAGGQMDSYSYKRQLIDDGELAMLAMNPFPRLLGKEWGEYTPTFEASEELLEKLSGGIGRIEAVLNKIEEGGLVEIYMQGKLELTLGSKPWRMLALGQLAGLCRLAEITARGLGNGMVAEEARQRGEQAMRDGEALINEIGIENLNAEDFDYNRMLAALPWRNLLFLGEAGENALLKIVENEVVLEYGNIEELTAMYINPGTQAKAVEIISRAPKFMQYLMAENISARGSEIWVGGTLGIDGAAPDWEDSEFGRIFRACSGLEERMGTMVEWRREARRNGVDPDLSVMARVAEEVAGENGLGREWVAAFIQRMLGNEVAKSPVWWFCEGDYCKLYRGSMKYVWEIHTRLKSIRGTLDPSFLEDADETMRVVERILASGVFSEEAIGTAWDAEHHAGD